MQPDFDLGDVDLVTCGNSMLALLKFAQLTDCNFRFNIQVVGKTTFFVRKENWPSMFVQGPRSYGQAVEKAYKSWEADVERSEYHYRLLQYDFGGLRCLVRSECDGYLWSETEQSRARPRSSRPFTDFRQAAPLQQAEPNPISDHGPARDAELTVRLGGHQVPQAATFDLKTRPIGAGLKLKDDCPRLWINQTPHFIQVHYTKKRINDVNVLNVRDQVLRWEARNTRLLGRFHTVIRTLMDFVAQSDDEVLEVRRMGAGPLQILRRTEGPWSALPPDLNAMLAG